MDKPTEEERLGFVESYGVEPVTDINTDLTFKDAAKTAKKMKGGGKVPPEKKGFSKLPEKVQKKMSPDMAQKYNMGGMTMSDKMSAPMGMMNKPKNMGMMNKGYAHGGGIRKVKY